ncbi:MAG: inositol monophosphatase family protein [Chlamydiota bacterium]|nr:inositol monophosphatase family protein [Chlamydiota bacterium]
MDWSILNKTVTAINHYLDVCQGALSTFWKEDRSPVTIADIGVQVLVNQMIRRYFPQDRLFSEEHTQSLSASILDTTLSNLRHSGHPLDDQELRLLLDYRGNGKSPYCWFVDPIDGTKGYLRQGQFAVALARYHENEALCACLVCPQLCYPTLGTDQIGTVFYWEKGSLAIQYHLKNLNQSEQISCGGSAQPIILRSVEKEHGNMDINEKLRHLLHLESFIAMDSQAKYGLLTRKEASVYLRMPNDLTYQEKTWDHGAGLALVCAAGGTVTDSFGNPLDFTQGETLNQNRGVLATIGIDHKLALNKLKTIIQI